MVRVQLGRRRIVHWFSSRMNFLIIEISGSREKKKKKKKELTEITAEWIKASTE